MTVLLERFPYRFCETEERGWIEKFSHITKRYSHMYEVGCELQMATLLDDFDYCKWLDPEGVPCYNKSNGRVPNPYPSNK